MLPQLGRGRSGELTRLHFDSKLSINSDLSTLHFAQSQVEWIYEIFYIFN